MSALAKKLQIKPGKRWLLFNTPDNYLATLGPLSDIEIFFEPKGQFDGVQLFVRDTTELTLSLTIIAPVLKHDAVFWITYPKKNSGIDSDLEMMGSWDICKEYNLRPVSSAAINEIWTALRFRPEGQSKLSGGSKKSIRKNEYSEFIDVDNKQIKLSAEIFEALQHSPQAMAFYQQLSYSNKKEYVLWILTAKQEKTRHERLVKMVEKLNAGKKNPGEK
ncbi:YdeI/OmpD-associated family protein [Mucilaginibacter sp.]|uniref:YdeI/OmpD-associated family protein n=1 Tax=Mucilaginibacter sp. TaxID=1882438 RepID=UPI00262D677C|nr:YdeI/OmpD-associated family protein [Mucilaginibacter sp.]MDB5030373.1 hypothetical protein [Mucilaginibacter sp.]